MSDASEVRIKRKGRNRTVTIQPGEYQAHGKDVKVIRIIKDKD